MRLLEVMKMSDKMAYDFTICLDVCIYGYIGVICFENMYASLDWVVDFRLTVRTIFYHPDSVWQSKRNKYWTSFRC